MAVNALEVTPGTSWRLARQRWGGSLIEDAVLDAPLRLLTVAPHAVSAALVVDDGSPAVQSFAVELTEADVAVRVVGHEPPARGGVSLQDARVVVGGGRVWARRPGSRTSRSWPACSVAPSAARAS